MFQLRLSHGLYNAGILGFINILKFAGKESFIHYSKRNNIFSFDLSALSGFEEDYYRYFIATYEESTLTKKVITEFEILTLQDPAFSEHLKNWEKSYTEKIKSSSFISAYHIIADYFEDSFPYEEKVKAAKKERDVIQKYEYYREIIVYLKKHQDIFIFKNIMYSVIQNYWSGISFLNSSSSKKEIKEELKKTFVPEVDYILAEKAASGKYECNECGHFFEHVLEPVGAWVSDFGIDFKRKSSFNWAFSKGEEVCAICKLIYACIPAGFYTIDKKGIFINVNSSVEDLLFYNNVTATTNALKSYEDLQELRYGQLVRETEKMLDKTQMNFLLSNVQIIRREILSGRGSKYNIEYLSHKEMLVFKKAYGLITYYKRIVVKEDKDTYVSIYREILLKISNHEGLYDLLGHLFKMAFRGERPYRGSLINLLKIERIRRNYMKYSEKEAEKQMAKEQAKISVMYHKGLEIRNIFIQNKEDVDTKLRGLIYQLINALQSKNKDAFMDKILRLYASIGEKIPMLFVEALKDEEDFMNYGYAFLIGLKGQEEKRKESDDQGI